MREVSHVNCRSELRHISEYFAFYFASNPCRITLQGLNCFREDVLYFSIAPDASLYLNVMLHEFTMLCDEHEKTPFRYWTLYPANGHEMVVVNTTRRRPTRLAVSRHHCETVRSEEGLSLDEAIYARTPPLFHFQATDRLCELSPLQR